MVHVSIVAVKLPSALSPQPRITNQLVKESFQNEQWVSHTSALSASALLNLRTTTEAFV